ncbi:hypothetical protein GUITHDRAFT_113834 [Guillardia theta CCMP2712]|uniref:Uncharacterized protein n=1 Tax=Guillardia theta (strain CCMP2712) TaxID=905079 RepID=L1IVF7_GUITC|nr:hypothetical protein GUITHDRAFT_113834 [Guillardia theta CCMP2712]EKX40097.1 hypothetical protein GUITHDRAFT_113834 [Guillardia theta CCMP2712]|eukprot:XP_005827077.1 hypothetical protein GUITHDRAFT_113834 [Guillardia theta CCMP2712]
MEKQSMDKEPEESRESDEKGTSTNIRQLVGVCRSLLDENNTMKDQILALKKRIEQHGSETKSVNLSPKDHYVETASNLKKVNISKDELQSNYEDFNESMKLLMQQVSPSIQKSSPKDSSLTVRNQNKIGMQLLRDQISATLNFLIALSLRQRRLLSS